MTDKLKRLRAKPPVNTKFMRGDSIVEMTFLVTVGAMIMVVLAEGAIICSRVYVVTQLAYEGARYASVNPSYSAATVASYVKQLAPPNVDSNSGNQLAVTVSPSSVPRPTGSNVKVTVSYTFPTPFLMTLPSELGVSMPKTLTASNTAMTE